ncbi:MAG: hypothetical protein LCH99_13420, partial [Proteobacteria bacterium]|nr:hypothetical protein [Pseudomonadota bacterium]
AGIVDAASQTLGAIDGRLMSTAERFSTSAERASDMVSTTSRLLEGKVDRLSDISSGTLSQIGGIVGRFEDHSKILSQASDLLAAAQSNLVSTLEERQDALRSLSVGLVQRSEEIEKTMQSLEGMVEGVFTRAEERSNLIAGNLRGGIQTSFAEVGRILGETEKRAEAAANTLREQLTKAGEEAGQSVEGSFARAEERTKEVANRLRGSVGASLSDVDRLLTESGKKSEAATTVMRETLREAVEEAVGKFSGATEEIRRAAADIRKELDQTRGELKRGAFDLPEEAKENAAQMRRAVSEQIKALQDLSDIIGKSSSALEVSRPAAVQAKVVQQAQPVQETRVEPRREEPAQQLRGSLGLERAAPATVPQRAQPLPAESEAKTTGEGGWMRDLLRGAVSREEAQFGQPRADGQAARPDSRNPRHVVESLNSLSVDIARAIDHDASVDLWRRYQRGERDVFTRRLYTLKGQQTFDEIKRKYEREPEFRTAVDRYISDFEKLLADVARNDRDKVMTQTYLTSDTGKVYTMLAHAAGRFS